MDRTALVILAAGIGSRYGAGVKQLAGVGPSGEIIIDYSIHDALKAGFDEVVFIIRHEIESDFREVIGERIAAIAPVSYAFQEMEDLPPGYAAPAGRTKPWGTAHALLSVRDLVESPFLVINADDFYGAEAYVAMHDFLAASSGDRDYCMAGYVLGHTLSPLGSVSRGVCEVDGEGFLSRVRETYSIRRREDGLIVGSDLSGSERILDEDSTVSMNMWGLKPSVFKALGERLPDFLTSLPSDDITSEFLLPSEIDRLIGLGEASVRVLPVDAHWYGVTYREDVQGIRGAIEDMVSEGIYEERLFG